MGHVCCATAPQHAPQSRVPQAHLQRERGQARHVRHDTQVGVAAGAHIQVRQRQRRQEARQRLLTHIAFETALDLASLCTQSRVLLHCMYPRRQHSSTSPV